MNFVEIDKSKGRWVYFPTGSPVDLGVNLKLRVCSKLGFENHPNGENYYFLFPYNQLDVEKEPDVRKGHQGSGSSSVHF